LSRSHSPLPPSLRGLLEAAAQAPSFHTDLLERIMDFASLFDSLTGAWGDEILFWVVAAVAGFICLIAVVNVLDMFLDNEVDPPMKDPR
jgi:hypothetical protein